MIKNHLLALIDVKLIVFLAVVIALCVILTLLFKENVKEFATEYKRKFYIYVFSFVLIYAIVAFLGYNKLFSEVTFELLFYQIASLMFGILHVWLYRSQFYEFNTKKLSIELLFLLLVALYSSVPFIIIYTVLNGIGFSFIMCGHFLWFIVPTGIYAVFNYMMDIPSKEYVTWQIPPGEKPYPEIADSEMRDLLLITLLIHKKPNSADYISIRSKGPVRIDFGNLFYHTVTGYNEHNSQSKIELQYGNKENFNWVFFIQPARWFERAKYVDANFTLGMNGITENSVIICKRQKKEQVKTNEEQKPEKKEFMFELKPKNSQKNENKKKTTD